MIFDYNFKNYNFRIILYMLALSTLGVLVVGSASGLDRGTVLSDCWLRCIYSEKIQKERPDG